MICINSVSKKFGDNIALSNINIKLKKGEVTALIGENGAGKSTLMRIMCGYIAPTSGNVSIFGHDIEKDRIKALSCMGYVPEISSLYMDMTVYDFLEWIANIWQINDVCKTIIDVAEQMKIKDVLLKKIETLSKGYKKRVEIASALIHSPQLLILDEPTDGLDPNQKFEIREFIKEYAKNNTVLISTHVLEDTAIANRVIMLQKGEVINDSTVKEFKKLSQCGDLSDAFRILSNSKEKN